MDRCRVMIGSIKEIGYCLEGGGTCLESSLVLEVICIKRGFMLGFVLISFYVVFY